MTQFFLKCFVPDMRDVRMAIFDIFNSQHLYSKKGGRSQTQKQHSAKPLSQCALTHI